MPTALTEYILTAHTAIFVIAAVAVAVFAWYYHSTTLHETKTTVARIEQINCTPSGDTDTTKKNCTFKIRCSINGVERVHFISYGQSDTYNVGDMVRLKYNVHNEENLIVDNGMSTTRYCSFVLVLVGVLLAFGGLNWYWRRSHVVYNISTTV